MVVLKVGKNIFSEKKIQELPNGLKHQASINLANIESVMVGRRLKKIYYLNYNEAFFASFIYIFSFMFLSNFYHNQNSYELKNCKKYSVLGII